MSELVFAFGVGFNNFATGRGSMDQLVLDAQRALSKKGIAAGVTAWYGATGNLAVRSALPDQELADELERAFGRPFAVVESSELEAAFAALENWERPVNEPGVRWTPGAAFRVQGPLPPADLAPTRRGHFLRVTERTVAVLKRDFETPQGRLDPSRRQGGWGAISGDIAKQTGDGSIWTSRSVRPMLGLLAKVE
jgi:hypothetical protein